MEREKATKLAMSTRSKVVLKKVDDPSKEKEKPTTTVNKTPHSDQIFFNKIGFFLFISSLFKFQKKSVASASSVMKKATSVAGKELQIASDLGKKSKVS